MANEIAERYASGLYELADETNSIAEKKEQAEMILNVLEANPETDLLFRAVKVTKEEKKQFIENTFGKECDCDLVNLIKLVIDKGRVFDLEAILKTFITLAEEHLGIERAIVYSARPLEKSDLVRIQDALSKKTGKQIVLTNQIDSSLIAGIRVKVGNQITDITMAAKIDAMKNVLLKGGQA